MSHEENLPQAERLASREAFRGRTVRLSVDRIRLPNGHEMDFELIHHPGAAAIVAILEEDVLLVRQYRYATGGWLLEVPAGKLEPGEEPEACAGRELEEETGFRAGTLRPLGWIWTTPGFTDEKIWLFLATGLTATQSNLEGDELLQIERIPWKEALERARRGEIEDGKSTCALMRAARLLEGG
jgi:ADP-ribose pyrophosphatase